jgi:sigma-54 dependent transcriptional regulator, acetoin dehydrogenase operon transcriptional activator AcoR
MLASNALPTPERSLAIAQARQALIHGDAVDLRAPPGGRIEPWIARSWQRCIEAGQQPQQRVSFEPVGRSAQRAVAERNRALVSAARPVIERLSRAIADTRYFAVLTDAEGIVVDVGLLPDGTDDASRYARNIARIGVDLSAPRWPSRNRSGCTAASISSTTPASTAAPARRCSVPRATASACST